MTRSCIVAWLRVLLPLTALAILSVLFLLGRKPDPEASIPMPMSMRASWPSGRW